MSNVRCEGRFCYQAGESVHAGNPRRTLAPSQGAVLRHKGTAFRLSGGVAVCCHLNEGTVPERRRRTARWTVRTPPPTFRLLACAGYASITEAASMPYGGHGST